MKALYSALLKAQQSFKPIHKDKTAKAGAYSYKYADLGSVLDAVRDALLANGLLLTQPPSIEAGGVTVVSTVLTHAESGESIAARLIVPQDVKAQELGSWITYARRYTLCGLLCIVAEDDDDGAAATKETKTRKAPEKSAKPDAPPDFVSKVWATCRSLVGGNPEKARGLLEWLTEKHGVKASKDLDPAQLETYLNELDAHVRGSE